MSDLTIQTWAFWTSIPVAAYVITRTIKFTALKCIEKNRTMGRQRKIQSFQKVERAGMAVLAFIVVFGLGLVAFVGVRDFQNEATRGDVASMVLLGVWS